MEFKKGDVVQLKSGSPKMTVEDSGDFGFGRGYSVKYTWFDGSKKVENLFDPMTLKIVNIKND